MITNFVFFISGAMVIIIVIVIASFSNVKNVNIKEGILEFWKPRNKKSIFIQPIFSLDPVISSDGNVFKLHLFVNYIN